MRIPIKRLSPEAVIPRTAYEGDAGVDLCSIEDVMLRPFERVAVSTGLSVAIPNGYAGLVLPRSGLSLKQGITVVNAPGLIDSNYRGELKVPLINVDPDKTQMIPKGTRIAQLIVQKVESLEFDLVESLDETERGEAGFGSSGTLNKL